MRVLAALVLVVLCACSRGTAPSDRIVVIQEREPISLNPALEHSAAQTEWGMLLFNYLLKFDNHEHLVPDVATEVPTLGNHGISADGKTITYHLRNDVRFADGTRLTARDCVYSIQAMQNPADLVKTRYAYDRIVKAEAPNDTTLVIHLREPFAPLFTVVLAPQGSPILPAHLLAKYPNFNHLGFDEQPIGGGPYVVKHWYHGDRVEMDANPLYFRGKPHIEHLTVRFVPDPATGINQMRTHEADVFYNNYDLASVQQLQAVPNTTTMLTPVNAVGALIFNTTDPSLRDPAVRRALAQAIDAQTLLAKAYHNVVVAPNAGRGLFQFAYDPRYPLNFPYTPAQARALLAPRHLHVQLSYTSTLGGDNTVASLIAQQERAAGVDFSIRAYQILHYMAPAAAGGPIYGGNFQMAYWQFSNGDDPDVADQFGCGYIPPRGFNLSRYCDRLLDTQLVQARSTYDIATRNRAYSSVQQQLTEEMPMMLLFRRCSVDAYNTRVRGITGSVSSIFWDVQNWEI